MDQLPVKRRNACLRIANLTIEVEKPDKAQKGVKSILIDRRPVNFSGEPVIKADLLKDRSKALVKVIMG